MVPVWAQVQHRQGKFKHLFCIASSPMLEPRSGIIIIFAFKETLPLGLKLRSQGIIIAFLPE